MAQPTDAEKSKVARWQRPIWLTVTVFSVSLFLLMLSALNDWPADAGQLFYDLGVGVGIATAISIIVSEHLAKLDKVEQDRREAARRALQQTEDRLLEAEAERERLIKERQDEILLRLYDLDRGMAEARQGGCSWWRAKLGPTSKTSPIQIAGECVTDPAQSGSRVQACPYSLIDRIVELVRKSMTASSRGAERRAPVQRLPRKGSNG
jgi:hypothetical protein